MDRLETHLQSDHPASDLAAADARETADADHALWVQFAEAASADEFLRSWLALQCRMIPGVLGALILIEAPQGGQFTPVAIWPDRRRNLMHLTAIAEQALRDRTGVARTREHDGDTGSPPSIRHELAYPVLVGEQLCAVVVLDLKKQSDRDLRITRRHLHWGGGWLEAYFRRKTATGDAASLHRLQTVLDLIASGVGHDRFYGAAMAVATALATQFRCDRVSVGFLRRRHTQVRAVSHSAEFKKQTNLLRTIAEAMDEAIDQRRTVVYPAPQNGPAAVTRSHAELSQQHGAGSLCTTLLEAGGIPVGAVTLERPAERPFDPDTIELCQSVAAVVAPVLDLQRREDRWLIVKAGDSIRRYLSALVGPYHVALKVGTAAVLGFLAFCLFAEGDYRVTAKTLLEPVVQRAAVAPFDGYIREAEVRAGDLVTAGQLLCALDDRELRLERLKALSRLEEYKKQHHKAMAERDAAQVEILIAQENQAEAELALLEDQLAHTRLVAPFDGIVVTGDLSQSLGAPVEKGKVLFEVAPLDAYRVVVEVDERDVASIAKGQSGSVMLSAIPDDVLRITVEAVTPVSTAKEGRNFFRVEARLAEPRDRLRPGMEGAAKIEIDRRRLIWIWSHEVVDWVRLALWTWLP